MRVIIDTNLWISCLLGHRFHKLYAAVRSGVIRLVICEQLREEITRVFRRPKFLRIYDTYELSELLAFFDEEALSFNLRGDYPSLCRDPKDDYLLELAVSSSADFIVTGDKDLLELERIGKTVIVSPMDFDLILQNTGRAKMFHDVELEYN